MRNLKKIAGVALMIGTLAGMASADGHSAEYAGSKGYVGAAGAKGYVAAHSQYVQNHGHITIRHRSERRGSAPLHAVPGCPPRFNGIYRGNMYCVNGKPID